MTHRDPNALRRIVIAGGGTSGWMAAAALARHLHGAGTDIVLVESSVIGTVGVGEATIPTIRQFYARLGMSDADVMRACGGTAKLGIVFQDWRQVGHRFIHPFGLYGQDHGTLAFHHLWLDRRAAGEAAEIDAYSLGAQLALGGRMAPPPPGEPPAPLARYDWALHIDAARFAAHLRRWAEASGVRRIDARIERVEVQGDRVMALHLDHGERLDGDMFVDCTGFRSLLLGETLGTGFQDWSHWLPCDAAIAVQTENADEEPAPYTLSRARAAGWQWRIPLRHRAGNGLVYSSRHWSRDEATAMLLSDLPGRPVGEPRAIPFRSGRRDRAWAGNVVALGLAAGFLEPLESTSIALIETGIERLKQLLPDRRMLPALAHEFNDATAREWERVRDFIILHYVLGMRDEPFWRACRAMALPDTLSRKIALWDARAEFVRYRWEMFHPSSWLALYAGFGRMPHGRDPAMGAVDTARVGQGMARMRDRIAHHVAATPSHADFLDEVHG